MKRLRSTQSSQCYAEKFQEEEDLVSKYYDLQYKLRGKEKEIQEKDEDIKKKDNQLRFALEGTFAHSFHCF